MHFTKSSNTATTLVDRITKITALILDERSAVTQNLLLSFKQWRMTCAVSTESVVISTARESDRQRLMNSSFTTADARMFFGLESHCDAPIDVLS